jgi:hypothetical protein
MLLELLVERTGSEDPELPALLGEELSEDVANALKTEFEIMGVTVELLGSVSSDGGELETLSLELDREIEQLKAESKPKAEPPPVALSFADDTSPAAKPVATPAGTAPTPQPFSLSLDIDEDTPPEASSPIPEPEKESFDLAPAEAEVLESVAEKLKEEEQPEDKHLSRLTPFAATSEILIPDEVELQDEEDEEEESPRQKLSPLLLIIPLALIALFLLKEGDPPKEKSPSVDIVQALLLEQERMLKEERLKAIEARQVKLQKFVRDIRVSVSFQTLSGHLSFSEAEEGALFLTDLSLGEQAPPKLSPADLAAGLVPRPWIKRIELIRRQEPRSGESFSFETFIYLEDNKGSERIKAPATLACGEDFAECLFTLGESSPGGFEVKRLPEGKVWVALSGTLRKSE